MGPCSVTSNLVELLCRLRRGEPDAADDLARAVRPELLRIARAYVRDAALAEDVAQEAVLEVLATHHSLREDAAVRAWLRLIVRKQADRATRRLRPLIPVESAGQLPDWVDGPERVVERLGDVAQIRRALAVVRDADALLLRLRYLGEWTDAELAELVGAAPGTVRKRIHDARRRLRAAVNTSLPSQPNQEATVNELDNLFGRVVGPEDIPAGRSPELQPSGRRLETGLKILDAVVPVERGGTVDLLGPVGLGQLVLVAEIASHVGAVVIAAGSEGAFAGLVEDADLDIRAVVVDGNRTTPAAAAAAGDRLARLLAEAGHTVALVLDQPAWTAQPPASGAASGRGSVTAFRFAPHPRDGEPVEPTGARTELVFATEPFLQGHYPAIDVLRSRSALIDDELLDPVTVGAARRARETLTLAADVRAFLAQPLNVGAPFTGVPGEHFEARDATEALAALVR